MRMITTAFLSLLVFLPTVAVVLGASSNEPVVPPQQKLTKADIDRMMKELSNWGRWGKDDQLGAMNLITPAKRKQAAALVKEGVSISLARDTNTQTAQDNPQPYEHSMTLSGVGNRGQFSLDKIGVSFHGYQHTHLDA